MRPCFSCLWSCAGWIYDISGDYAAAFYSCGGISFLAASLTSFIPRLSTQSNQETGSKRLAKLLRRRRSNHRSEVMHVLFGCLWKEKQESRTSSFVQHSGIQITNKRVDVWNESNWSDTPFPSHSVLLCLTVSQYKEMSTSLSNSVLTWIYEDNKKSLKSQSIFRVLFHAISISHEHIGQLRLSSWQGAGSMPYCVPCWESSVEESVKKATVCTFQSPFLYESTMSSSLNY